MTELLCNAQTVYLEAREYVFRAGYHMEVEWQRKISFEGFTESQVLREAAWVVLCSGFRESVVRRVFDHVSLCFFDWESASLIVANSELCVAAAKASFGNESKLWAIAECAKTVVEMGFDMFKRRVLDDPIQELQVLPFIGPITSWHLAKNLGLDVAKPDRHLVRLAEECGYVSAFALCDDLARLNDEQTKVVDLILWRYLADHPVRLRNHHFTHPLRNSGAKSGAEMARVAQS